MAWRGPGIRCQIPRLQALAGVPCRAERANPTQAGTETPPGAVAYRPSRPRRGPRHGSAGAGNRLGNPDQRLGRSAHRGCRARTRRGRAWCRFSPAGRSRSARPAGSGRPGAPVGPATCTRIICPGHGAGRRAPFHCAQARGRRKTSAGRSPRKRPVDAERATRQPGLPARRSRRSRGPGCSTGNAAPSPGQATGTGCEGPGPAGPGQHGRDGLHDAALHVPGAGDIGHVGDSENPGNGQKGRPERHRPARRAP